MHCSLPVRSLAATALLSFAALSAQTAIGGVVFDGSGGPLLAGQIYFTTGTVTVPAGATLTIEPGAILKCGALDFINVLGTLRSLPGSMSHVTSFADDSVGGDTNGNGPSSGVPGDWNNLRCQTGGVVDLVDCRIAYGGTSSGPVVQASGGIVRLERCLIENGPSDGVRASGAPEFRLVDCHIQNCGGTAARSVWLTHLATWSGNTASGNTDGDLVFAAANPPTSNVTIGVDNLINDTIHHPGNFDVLGGTEVTLQQGVIVKLATGAARVFGTLRLLGTESSPVVFTSDEDDARGEDADPSIATVGTPGAWGGIRSQSNGMLVARHAHVRFGGATATTAAIDAIGGALDLERCRVEFAPGDGIDVNFGPPMRIAACHVEQGGGVAMRTNRLQVTESFDGNTANGCEDGDCVLVTGDNTNASVTTYARNLVNSTLTFNSGHVWLDPLVWTIGPGVVVKWPTFVSPAVDGGLVVRGTASRPVVFTSTTDDSVGADLSGPGVSVGAPGDWNGVRVAAIFGGGPGFIDAEHLHVRFAGRGSNAGIDVRGLSRLVSVRSEFHDSEGFRLRDGVALQNCVAFANSEEGFFVADDAATLDHCVAVSNLTGVRSQSNDLLLVRNSIFWSNTTDIGASPLATYEHCIADSAVPQAVDGNLNTDPLFVDEVAGDLQLLPGSPAVDAADFAVGAAVGRDADDGPRLTSPSGLGGLLPDIGAFEQARWRLSRTGEPRLGNAITLQVDGEPGITLFAYAPTAATPTAIVVEPLGTLLLDPIGLLTLSGELVGTPLVLTLPMTPGLVDAQFSFQALTFALPGLVEAQLSNVETVRIAPALP